MSVYERKLYALMHQELQDERPLACYGNNLDQLQNWWQQLVDQEVGQPCTPIPGDFYLYSLIPRNPGRKYLTAIEKCYYSLESGYKPNT